MFCHECGMPLPQDSQFCPFCGTDLKDAQPDKAPEASEVRTNATTNHIRSAIPPFAKPEAMAPETESVQEEVSLPETHKTETPPAIPQMQPYGDMARSQAPRNEDFPAPAAPKKKKTKKILLVAAIALVVILAAVLVPLYMSNKKKQVRYDEGAAMLESGNYGEALDIFEKLNGFSDSEDKAKHAKQGLEYESAVKKMNKGRYDEAIDAFKELGDFKDSSALMATCQKAKSYEKALVLFDAGNYEDAEALFKSAGDYKDSSEFAATCQKAMNYEKGKVLFDAGNYEDAEALFKSAGDYRDASQLAVQSRAQLDYAQAKLLMDSGDYVAAKELLLPLDSAIIPDRDELINECDNMDKYNAAKELQSAGKNYDAYKIFKELGDFLDSPTLASDCAVANPRTGEIYRNNDYRGTRCTLKIKPPTGDGSRTYIKIYASDDTLVSCVFINAGDQAKIKIPPGNYKFKAAYSFGPWFGETEMFGDEGYYQALKASLNDDIFKLKANYIYTLTLRSSKTTGGDNVITVNENRGDF